MKTLRSRIDTCRILIGCIAAIAMTAQPSLKAALVLSGTSYDQNFDNLSTGLPSDWTVRTGATASSLGTAATFSTTAIAWSDSGGAFKNLASATGLTSTTSAALQAAATDRALGIRQTAAVGDPGAAFTLEIANTTGFSGFSLSLDLEMLSVQTRSTTWNIQYGIGAAPTSFSSIFTYSDPGVFGITPTGTISLGSALDNIGSSVWIRVVALTLATGAGSRDSFGIDSFHLGWSSAAADMYFDLNGSAAGIGGTGVWDTTTANWNPLADGTGTPTTITSASKAVFGGTAGAVTVDAGGVAANGGIQFDTPGYTVSGGIITLGSPTINTSHATGVTTIQNVLAGSTGLQKIGVGTLELTGANTFTGAVAINAGTLRIGSDSALGATTNGVQLGGGKLLALSSVALDAARALTGGGSIEAGAGLTLSVPGAVTVSALTFDGAGTLALTGNAATISTLAIAGTGTVALSGTTPTITALAFSGAGTVSSTNAVLNNGITTTHATGTATVSAPLDFGATSRNITVADGSANVDLLLSGALTNSGTGRIIKLGDGTLELTGTNSIIGLQLGTAGTTPANGGRVIIHDADDVGNLLGASQFRFNAGTLEVQGGPLTLALGASIGAGQLGNGATFTGSPITFQAASSLFKGTGSYQHKITANTDVTFEGGLNTSAGTGTSTGLTIAGTGTVFLPNAVNTIAENITVDAGTLAVSGALTGSMTLQNNGTLKPGTIADPTGTLSTGALTVASTGILQLDIGGTAAGDSDQLNVTGSVTLAGTLNASLFGGYIPGGADALTIILNDDVDLVSGTFTGLPEGAAVGATGLYITYAGGDGNDVALTAVPEPGSAVMLLGGLAILGARRRRR